MFDDLGKVCIPLIKSYLSICNSQFQFMTFPTAQLKFEKIELLLKRFSEAKKKIN